METSRWNLIGIVYAVILASTFVMLVLSIPYGTYAVFFTHLSSSYGPQTQTGFLPVYIGLLTVDIPLAPTFGELYIALTALYCLFIALAISQGGGMLRAFAAMAKEGLRGVFLNPMTAMIMLLGATLLATVVLQSVQSSAGVPTGGLSGDPFLLLMDLTLAPVIEEVGYRFFLIGVPLFLLLLASRPSPMRALKTLWRPSAAWEPAEERAGRGRPDAAAATTTTASAVDDAPTDASRYEASEREPAQASVLKNFTYFLIAFSSILFGLAHYLSGAGWDVGKVSEAALDGVALGYLYVRYGLHASILFHWAVDFASNAFAFYGQGVYGISWTANSSFSLIPTYQIIVVVGLPGLLYLANIFLKRVISPRSGTNADDSSRQVYPDAVSGEVQSDLSDLPRRLRRRWLRPDGP